MPLRPSTQCGDSGLADMKVACRHVARLGLLPPRCKGREGEVGLPSNLDRASAVNRDRNLQCQSIDGAGLTPFLCLPIPHPAQSRFWGWPIV
jgi:hypothetical protein